MTTESTALVLRYTDSAGKAKEFDMGKDPIVIGRAPSAEIVFVGPKVSRRHCEIRFWDRDYVVKDLHSKNGILVNGEPVKSTVLKMHDILDVGGFELSLEAKHSQPGARTVVRQVEEDIQSGKGYRTVLREIVESVEPEDPEPRE